MGNIKVKDLTDTSSITTDNQLMVLTNDENNAVQNITVEKFLDSVVSSDADNGISLGLDDKLYVDNSDSGVTAGTYQYPQNLVVNEKGKITSLISGSPANVPIATSSAVGIVKPDNTSLIVANDGTLSWVGDLSSKADVDLTNVNATGDIKMAHNAMPSWDTYVDLTLGASGATYTAPADGYFLIDKIGLDQQYLYVGGAAAFNLSASGTQGLCATIPVRKGQEISISYNATGATNNFKFIYAVGSESEA